MKYGSATLTGSMLADRVCLSDYSDSQTCVSDFGFFLITKQTGLSAYNGILGLSPNSGSNGPSYVGALYSQGLIQEETVSFQLNAQGTQSVIQFGFQDTTRYTGLMYSAPL